jgi:hypothetical protein
MKVALEDTDELMDGRSFIRLLGLNYLFELVRKLLDYPNLHVDCCHVHLLQLSLSA